MLLMLAWRHTGLATGAAGALCFAAFGSGTADHRFSEQTKQTEEERQVQHPIGRRREVASEILFVGQQQGRHAFMQLCWWHSGGLPAQPLDGADMLCGSLFVTSALWPRPGSTNITLEIGLFRISHLARSL